MQEHIVIQEETGFFERIEVSADQNAKGEKYVSIAKYEGDRMTKRDIYPESAAIRLRDALNMILNKKK